MSEFLNKIAVVQLLILQSFIVRLLTLVALIPTVVRSPVIVKLLQSKVTSLAVTLKQLPLELTLSVNE